MMSTGGSDCAGTVVRPLHPKPHFLVHPPSPTAGVKPATIELTSFKTKEVVETLEVDAVMVATGRAPYTNGLNLAAVGAETDRCGQPGWCSSFCLVCVEGCSVPAVLDHKCT